MYIYIIIKMDKFEILKSEKYNVGNIQKQLINITTKTKGKPLDQADIKNIVKLINDKYLRDKKRKLKYLCVVCLRLESGP